MKSLLIIAGLFLGAMAHAQDPFSHYRKEVVPLNGDFYPQEPPFAYPFEVSSEVPNKALDLERLQRDFPEDTLNNLKGLYDGLRFIPRKSVYSFPFSLHPHWNFLPYPFLRELPHSDPASWVSHFAQSPVDGEGIAGEVFHRELDELTGTRAYYGNELRFLKTPEAYREILTRIRAAKDHAFISTYFFHCDKGTEELVELIGQKVEEGVGIYILMDKLAAKSHPACPHVLRRKGAKVLFPRTSITKFFHDKMFVFDGEFAQIDGQNLIAPATKSDGANNLFNDLSLLLKGPAVTAAGARFIDNWERLAFGKMPAEIKELYRRQELANRKLEFSGKVEDGLCRVVTKAPGKGERQILELYLHTARSARHYLFFNYFDPRYRKPFGKEPGEQFLDAVIDRARENRELRVDMLTNGWLVPFHVEMKPGEMAPVNFMQRLLLGFIDLTFKKPHKEMRRTRKNLLRRLDGANFNWWIYAQFMHSKALMADNAWTIIGSYNINPTAEKSSYEMVVACFDRKVAALFQRSIVQDALNSIPVPLK